jgi:hypothetical protein
MTNITNKETGQKSWGLCPKASQFLWLSQLHFPQKEHTG